MAVKVLRNRPPDGGDSALTQTGKTAVVPPYSALHSCFLTTGYQTDPNGVTGLKNGPPSQRRHSYSTMVQYGSLVAAIAIVVGAFRHRTMEAGMRSEQLYWMFTVSVDQMDKFAQLIPKLVAATENEPGALQFEFNIGADQKTVDIFERYTDSKAALLHQAQSFAPHSKEFFAAAKLTRWVIYGTPSDEFKKANADFDPIYMTPSAGFVR